MSASASAHESAARLRARRGSQALFASAALHLWRIFSVWATERQATRGWGRPKFHSQVLIWYTWLPLRNTISKLGTTYSTYEILAWLRLFDLWLPVTNRPVHHAATKVTYDLLIILLFSSWWFTYANHVHLLSRMIYLWFTYDLLTFYLCFTYYLWSTYSTYDLLMQIM